MEFVWKRTLEESPDARDIRMEVFVQEQGYDQALEFDGEDPAAWHLTVYQNGRAVATGRIMPKEGSAWILGRIAVRKALRGTGLGAVLVEEMSRKAAELGALELHVSAQTQARGFYEKMGFRAPREETYMDGHILHIHMEKKI